MIGVPGARPTMVSWDSELRVPTSSHITRMLFARPCEGRHANISVHRYISNVSLTWNHWPWEREKGRPWSQVIQLVCWINSTQHDGRLACYHHWKLHFAPASQVHLCKILYHYYPRLSQQDMREGLLTITVNKICYCCCCCRHVKVKYRKRRPRWMKTRIPNTKTKTPSF